MAEQEEDSNHCHPAERRKGIDVGLHLMQQTYSVKDRPDTRTVILLATLSNCEASSLILWTILSSAPPSCKGSDRWAKALLPQTKCNWTAAVSFFSASRPCHTIGYFCLKGDNKSQVLSNKSQVLTITAEWLN